jgi:4-alpha-glucanotransferase
MKFKRSSGILFHPTSLPGPDGIGDLGPEAYQWIESLAKTGCRLWQILPLGPTGYGDSPYQCFSAFAGNPYLVSPVFLMEDGLLTRQDLIDRPEFPKGNIDFGAAISWKLTILDRAFEHFNNHPKPELVNNFEIFTNEQAYWLDDYACFMALKEQYHGQCWENWEPKFRMRNATALKRFRKSNREPINRHSFRQFLFFRQWQMLRRFAKEKHIQIVGDIPIFVSYDSSDAWGNPELFYFDENRNPTVVAGVPPDYFSETGQLWGNPLYNWEYHKKTGYAWWLSRIQATLNQVDIIRLDHFRGFYNYWEIPFGMPTAKIGKWVFGPGADFFETVQSKIGDLPIIAEDLGQLDPGVFILRDQLGLPGMKILQFAFEGGPKDLFLPHNYPENCVTYTGTHDNDTSRGWYESAPQNSQDFCRRYLASDEDRIAWSMIRCIWSSVAVFAIAPLQDFLTLGTEARMNFPGKPSGNWGWRMQPNSFTKEMIEKIEEINYLFGRKNEN